MLISSFIEIDKVFANIYLDFYEVPWCGPGSVRHMPSPHGACNLAVETRSACIR